MKNKLVLVMHLSAKITFIYQNIAISCTKMALISTNKPSERIKSMREDLSH